MPLVTARPFLLGEFDRFESGVAQRVGGRPLLAAMHDVTLAEQCERTVGERCEIAARPERAVFGHDRRDAGVEDVDHRLGDERSGTAVAERERAGPQEHHRSHDFVLDGVTHAGGVRADEGGLQGPPPVGRDRHGGERAEPGGDAVLRLTLGEALDDGAGRGHSFDRRIGELDRFATTGDGDDVVDGDAGPVEVDGHVVRSSPLMRSSRSSCPTASVNAPLEIARARRVGARHRRRPCVRESVRRADDRDGDAEPADARQGEAHRRDVGFDGARAGRDHTRLSERGAERGAGQLDVLADPAHVTDRPAALGGGDVGAGAPVAHREIGRLAGLFGEPIEMGLGGRRQPVEHGAAAQGCGDAQDRRARGVVAGDVAIDIAAGFERPQVSQGRGRGQLGGVGRRGQVAATRCEHDLEQVEDASDRTGQRGLLDQFDRHGVPPLVGEVMRRCLAPMHDLDRADVVSW